MRNYLRVEEEMSELVILVDGRIFGGMKLFLMILWLMDQIDTDVIE